MILRHAAACALLLLTTAPGLPAAQTAAATDIPGEKQTALGLYLTAKEAFAVWQSDPEHVRVLDVRTPEEYMFVGHGEMAVNIPLSLQTYDWDAEKEHFAMKPNPDFLAQVQAWAQPGDKILVMCRSGGRSAKAVDKLAEAGFTNVYSIVDGMEGDAVKDPDSADKGKRTVNGWKNAGNPWTYKVDPGLVHWPADQAVRKP